MEERYEIRGKIGQGAMSVLYQGYDLRMNRDVAIKRIIKTGANQEIEDESIRRLLKESGTLTSVKHPNIVTIYDVGSDEDGPYLVMEFVNGKTLEELIEKSPLTWSDFIEVVLQTQEGLIAAHERNLIHNDIKPSNFMFTWLPSGKFQVKIMNLCLTTLVRTQSKEKLETLEAVFGSLYFMAPEQFERLPLDCRSDIYSMGCVYYYALTGIYPFDGETGDGIMNSHLDHVVKPLQELRSDIPRWVCDWVMWMINRYPHDRPVSARQALSLFMLNHKNPSVRNQ